MEGPRSITNARTALAARIRNGAANAKATVSSG